MHKTILTFPLIALASYGLVACSDHHDHDGHDHAAHEEGHEDHAGHDHDPVAGDEAGGDHSDHMIVAGPNNGRVIDSTEPPLEFLVTEDRKVRLTPLDEELAPVPLGTLTATAISGDRADPTRLTFVAQEGSLVSDVPLPEGNDFPIVLQVKANPDADPVVERFNLNLEDCPTCDNLEYACICDHEHDH